MIKRTLVAAALAFALASGAVQAVNVVDTGTPSNTISEGFMFNKYQSFAGKFSLLSDAVLNSIQGYFSTDAGNVAISVYSNSVDPYGTALPGTLKFSTTLVTNAGALAWNGVSGLDWALTQGTYWVAFASDYSSFDKAMQGGAPTPLAAYAVNSSGWGPSDALVGVRIDATVAAPVPEPAGIAMYALGLAGLAVVARRRKQA